MSADWFARNLRNEPARPAPAPYKSPQGLRIPTAQPEPVTQQPALVAAPPQEQITGQENFQGILDEAARNGENVSFTKLSKHWKGGEGMRSEGHLRCPNPSCGSLNIFTRSSVRVMNDKGVSAHAKSRCFDCGWTEGHIQGEAANWGS